MFHEIHPLCKLSVANIYGDTLLHSHTDGCVGYWDASNSLSYGGSGTTWNNLNAATSKSPYNRHLTLVNGTSFLLGAGSEPAQFVCDGSDDYIGAAAGGYGAPAFQINNSQSYTICFWVKMALAEISEHHFLTTGNANEEDSNFNGLQFGAAIGGSLEASFMKDGTDWVDGHEFPNGTRIGNKWQMLSFVHNCDLLSPDVNRSYFFSNARYCPIDEGDEEQTLDWEESINGALAGITAPEFGRTHNVNEYEYTPGDTAFSLILIYDRTLLHSEIISNFNATKGDFGY